MGYIFNNLTQLTDSSQHGRSAVLVRIFLILISVVSFYSTRAVACGYLYFDPQTKTVKESPIPRYPDMSNQLSEEQKNGFKFAQITRTEITKDRASEADRAIRNRFLGRLFNLCRAEKGKARRLFAIEVPESDGIHVKVHLYVSLPPQTSDYFISVLGNPADSEAKRDNKSLSLSVTQLSTNVDVRFVFSSRKNRKDSIPVDIAKFPVWKLFDPSVTEGFANYALCSDGSKVVAGKAFFDEWLAKNKSVSPKKLQGFAFNTVPGDLVDAVIGLKSTGWLGYRPISLYFPRYNTCPGSPKNAKLLSNKTI